MILTATDTYLAGYGSLGTTSVFGPESDVVYSASTNSLYLRKSGSATNVTGADVTAAAGIRLSGHLPLTTLVGGFSAYGVGQAGPVKPGLVSAQDTNTFVASLTGLTTVPTGTCRYTLTGKQVVLYVTNILGTSNATLMTLTGLPALITPARNQVMNCFIQDSGVVGLGRANINSSGIIGFERYSAINAIGNFVASGGKGVTEQVFTYSVD
jgi:hypothetical protein